MVKIEWITQVTGEIDSSDAVFNPDVNTRTFGEIAHSHTIVNNATGEDTTISFKTKSGTEAFTYTLPDGSHNLFWKTAANGTPLWAFVVSSSSVSTTVVDSNGDYYLVTSHNAPIAFYSSTGALSQTVALQGGLTQQTVIAKYNSSGIFQWVIRFGSNESITIPRIHFDGDFNMYVIGDYGANITILDTDAASSTITGGSNTDMFVVSFDPAGERRWTAKLTGTDLESVSAVEVFGDHVYITGIYKSDPLVLAPGTGSTKNFVGGVGPGGPVGYGITLALLKATGAYGWAAVFDAPADLKMITTQSHSSGIVIVGTIPSEDVEIKNGDNEVIGEIVSQEGALNGVFIVKMSHTGEYLWHVKVNAIGTGILMSEEIFGYHSGSILDSAGNVYLKAHYFGDSETPGIPQVFDKDDVLVGNLPQSEADLESLSVLLLKLTPTGTLSWITTFKPAVENEIVCSELHIDSSGNLYMTANASPSNIRLFNSRSTPLSSAGSPAKTITTNTGLFFNPLIISYSSAGKYRWFVHLQYPEIEFFGFNKASNTRMDRMNLFFNLFNNRLGLTPTGRVYLNLVGFPGTNDIFIENTKTQSLTFEEPLPYLLALDGSKSVSESSGMALVALILLVILAIGVGMFLRRRR
jgi:hypothetical protein